MNGWRQNSLTVFADHGLTRRFTLTAKLNFQDYHIGATRFSGLGSAEIGGRFTLRQTRDFVLALGASAEGLGKGRRDEFDTALRRGTDYDLRAYLGRSFHLGGANAFIDLEAARHLRQFNPSQWRVDATLGVKPTPKLMLLAQVFSGQADRSAGIRSQWTQGQISLVHAIGSKASLQVGYRQMIAGRNVPLTKTLIVSLWRNF
ncbi:MAG: hypothetical protein ACXU8U_11695 [Asticcacaulis sp.]